MTFRLHQYSYSETLCKLTYISATCPQSWIHLRDSCYRFSDKALAWREAQFHCEALGSNLAVVTSQAEQQALASNVKHLTWIGLYRDPKSGSRWLWVDESLVAYTNWYTGEPNDSGGAEDCVEFLFTPHHEVKWNDKNCNRPLRYVCEISGKKEHDFVLILRYFTKLFYCYFRRFSSQSQSLLLFCILPFLM